MLESDLKNLELLVDQLLQQTRQKKLENISLNKKLNDTLQGNNILANKKKLAIAYLETMIKQLEDELYVPGN